MKWSTYQSQAISQNAQENTYQSRRSVCYSVGSISSLTPNSASSNVASNSSCSDVKKKELAGTNEHSNEKVLRYGAQRLIGKNERHGNVSYGARRDLMSPPFQRFDSTLFQKPGRLVNRVASMASESFFIHMSHGESEQNDFLPAAERSSEMLGYRVRARCSRSGIGLLSIKNMGVPFFIVEFDARISCCIGVQSVFPKIALISHLLTIFLVTRSNPANFLRNLNEKARTSAPRLRCVSNCFSSQLTLLTGRSSKLWVLTSMAIRAVLLKAWLKGKNGQKNGGQVAFPVGIPSDSAHPSHMIFSYSPFPDILYIDGKPT